MHFKKISYLAPISHLNIIFIQDTVLPLAHCMQHYHLRNLVCPAIIPPDEPFLPF